MQIINCEQGTPEWDELRALRISASHAQAIAANGKGLETYVRDRMRKHFSFNDDPGYSNRNMENGIELEASAALVYEFKTGLKVSKVGYVIHSDYVGCSPDRMVEKEGLVEIKCPTDKVYFDLLLDNKVDTEYDWQMQMQMLVCQRKWCDYVVYNPNFHKQIVVIRQYPDDAKFAKLIKGFESGTKRIKEILGLELLNSTS